MATSFFQRKLGRHASAIIVCLALGLAGAAGAFSVLQRFWNPLGTLEQGTWVKLRAENPEYQMQGSPSVEVFELWQSSLQSYRALLGVAMRDHVARFETGARILQVAEVGGSFFESLPSTLIVGRGFSSEDADLVGEVVITEATSNTSFGGAQAALGKQLTLNGQPRTIVGVADKRLDQLLANGSPIGALIPIDLHKHRKIQVLACLKDGVSTDQARAELRAWGESRPELKAQEDGVRWVVVSSQHLLDTATQNMAAMAFWGGILLLVITGSITGGLMATRRIAEAKEQSIRWAVGADGNMLFLSGARKLSLLVVLAVALGGFLTQSGLQLLIAFLPPGLYFLKGVEIDLKILMLLGLGSLLLTLSAGAAPSLFARANAQIQDLRTDSRFGRHSAAARFFSSLQVILMVATAFVLSVAAYLLVGSILQLGSTDLGFDADGLQTAEVRLPDWKYETPQEKGRLFESLQEELRALPGVETASLTTGGIPPGGIFFGSLETENGPLEPAPTLGMAEVGAEYFKTLRQPLVAGRDFEPRDLAPGSLPVAVLSESAAGLLKFSTADAVGKRLRLGETWYSVIGVAGDLEAPGILQQLGGAVVYLPIKRLRGSATLLAHSETGISPGSWRRLQDADPDLVLEATTGTGLIAESVAETRFLSRMLASLTLLTIALAVLGIYGALSRFVVEKRGQIALRLALGSSENAVRWWVFKLGLIRILSGLALGILLSYPACELLKGRLFGIAADAPEARVFALFAIGITAFAAIWIPAGEAGKVEPNEILRSL